MHFALLFLQSETDISKLPILLAFLIIISASPILFASAIHWWVDVKKWKRFKTEAKEFIKGVAPPAAWLIIWSAFFEREPFQWLFQELLSGKVVRNFEARVLRESEEIYKGKIDSLKRFKEDVREVKEGFECGVVLEKFNDLKEGDKIVCFEIREKKIL